MLASINTCFLCASASIGGLYRSPVLASTPASATPRTFSKKMSAGKHTSLQVRTPPRYVDPEVPSPVW